MTFSLRTALSTFQDLVVERDAGVGADAFLAGAKRSEILGGFGDDVVVELDDDSAFELPSNANVHETL